MVRTVCLVIFESTHLQVRQKKTREHFNRVIVPTTYNPRGPNVKAIVKTHSHLLSRSPTAGKIFLNGVIVAY